MVKLPPRRILRAIVEDAISDRQAIDDENGPADIAAHRALLPKLANTAPPLDDEAKDALAFACLHARLWRESYVESWLGTKDKAVIAQARRDVDKITRTETALGFRYRSKADVFLENAESVSLFDFMNAMKAA